MAKAKKVAPSTKETDIKEFFEALTLIGEEKGIPLEDLVDKIKTAIALAVKKGETGNEESIVEIDPETKRFYVAIRKEVVEEVETPATQITLEDAVKYDKKARVGEMVEIPLETKKFGRIAAQSAKHSRYQHTRVSHPVHIDAHAVRRLGMLAARHQPQAKPRLVQRDV